MTQRAQYKLYLAGDDRSSMTESRIAAMNALDFVWQRQKPKVVTITWEERFEEFLEYKRTHHGHVKVPPKYPQNLALANCKLYISALLIIVTVLIIVIIIIIIMLVHIYVERI